MANTTVKMNFDAQVLNTFEKEYDIKGQKVKGYNIGLLNEEGAFTMKCNKDVHEALKSELVKPLSKCRCVALYDPASQKNDTRIVALSVLHK